MMQSFVRYSPDVERADPNFEQNLQTVLENMKRHMRASFKVEGIGRVVRDAHAKGYGLARGEVEILTGLPAAYAQGIYAKFVNLLLSTYWTMGAVRHGDYIAKVRVAPVQEFADRVVRRTLDPNAEEQVFRPALVAELRERPYEFDIQVQLCTNLVHMPIEDVTVRWSETLSPFVTVAKLRLPQQDIGGEDNIAQMDATSMTPWRVTEEHRRLGNIMRARKEVYRQSSILRHQVNHQVRKEPKNLAEVFGS
jgi:hypothetical protein